MSLANGRNTVETKGVTIVLQVKAKTKIYEGSLVAIDGGYAIPAKKATGLIVAGRAEEFVDNTFEGNENGTAGIRIRRGVFKFDNDSANPVAIEHTLKDCYMLDDATVTSLATGASKAGKVLGLDGNEVIVEIS